MKINKNRLLLIMGVSMIAGLSSCTQTGNNNEQSTTDTFTQSQKQAYEQAKAVFYALPSPVETATTLEHVGVEFTDKYLHKTSDAEKYNTTTSSAVNVGIYTADLSFCALYEQNQLVIDYLSTVKKLSENLGIIKFFNDSTIQVIQDNINDKNKIVGIVSESYTRSTNFLDEQERNEIAATVIVGGWVETLYITINMLKDIDMKRYAADINEIVVNQQYTLEDLIGMLQIFVKKDDKDDYISQLESKLKNLKTKFDNVQKDGTISKEDIDAIKDEAAELRNQFIQ